MVIFSLWEMLTFMENEIRVYTNVFLELLGFAIIDVMSLSSQSVIVE